MMEKEWQVESKIKVREALRSLCNELNYMGNEDEVAEAFSDALNREHRTIQQGFWRMVNDVACRYTKENSNGRHDDRNKASVEFCERIANLDHYFPFI